MFNNHDTFNNYDMFNNHDMVNSFPQYKLHKLVTIKLVLAVATNLIAS